jgi:hypothetical protein
MNARLLIRSPRRRGRVASGARRGRVPWRSWVPPNKSLLVGHHGQRSSITPQSVRACMTATTIEASTGPQIRNRAPVLNSTSITPGDICNAVIGAASVGTFNVNDATRGAPYSCWRQRNSWLACIPASRATADATAPGSIAAATMRSFSALDHLRRCRTEVTIWPASSSLDRPQHPLSEPFDNLGRASA